MDMLELYKNIPISDYKLDEINLEDIQKKINEHGIRHNTIATAPGFYPIPALNSMQWKAEDINKTIEKFENLSKQEQGFITAMTEMSLVMQGIMPQREDNELRRLYYSKSIKK